MQASQQTTNINPDMNTLSSCMNRAHKSGFTVSFTVDEKGLTTADVAKHFTPDQVMIRDFYRFEGQSDPGDNSILYVIETKDGTKGTLVDAYGAYGDENIDKFMKQVDDIQKLNSVQKNS